MTRKNRHIVFDTETTGLPECSIDLITGERKYYDPNRLDKYAGSRVVQLAWIVMDDHGKRIVSKSSYVIRPDGYEIPAEATKVHGITHAFAMENGVSMKHALAAFRDALQTAHTVVAHNFLFDAYVLSSEAVRYGFSDVPNMLQAKNKFDTMVRAMQYFNLGKKPRLVDLYRILFKAEINQRHDALDDAMITAVCFSDLKSAMYRSKLRPQALVTL